MLASLITTQGILTCPTEEDIARYAPNAYRRYRRRYKLPIFGYKNKTVPIDESATIGLVDLLTILT